ncbi:MAG: type II secretion system F family protein [Bacilli bacterium]|nr:type II secretion system F family protein [Bacilli bacterium]
MKDSLSKRIYGIGTIKRITRKVNLLGLRIDPNAFVAFRFVSSFMLFFLIFFLIDYGYVIAPIFTVFYYYLVEVLFLDFNINKRAKELEYAAISYFPVFLISLRCSRSVRKSLEVTNKIVKNKLSYEFDKILSDVKVGKSLQESLTLAMDRMPSEIIVNILVSLIEADRLGNNIDKTVSIQLDYLKECNKKKMLHNYSMISIKLVFVFILYMILFLLALFGISYILVRI